MITVRQEQNKDVLLPDLALVRRAQAIYGDYTASRVEIVSNRPGNPLGAEVRRFEGATACRVPSFGEHLFNRALASIHRLTNGEVKRASA